MLNHGTIVESLRDLEYFIASPDNNTCSKPKSQHSDKPRYWHIVYVNGSERVLTAILFNENCVPVSYPLFRGACYAAIEDSAFDYVPQERIELLKQALKPLTEIGIYSTEELCELERTRPQATAMSMEQTCAW